MLYQDAPRPTPPTAPPDATHTRWLNTENERLLEIISRLVGNDEQSIQNYLDKEGLGRTVYQRISERTELIMSLVQP